MGKIPYGKDSFFRIILWINYWSGWSDAPFGEVFFQELSD